MTLGLSALLLLSGTSTALEGQEPHLVVISGLGGDPQFRADFVEWGARLVDAARDAGVDPGNIVFLAEDPDADPERISGRSTAEVIEETFASVASRAAPEDRVLVVLIGHGSGSGEESRVSIPGPSLTAADYRRLLETLAPRQVALVNAASASGDFIPVIAGDGRIVVTATRSAQQRNATIFGRHFVEAFTGDGADLDRDGRVSLLEAFEYARQETERHFRDRGLISSEQALLEDRSDGRGVALPTEDPEVGLLASRFFLQPPGGTAVAGDPAASDRLRELYMEEDAIETRIAQLGGQRDELGEEAYQDALQELIVELARIGQEIRALEEGG